MTQEKIKEKIKEEIKGEIKEKIKEMYLGKVLGADRSIGGLNEPYVIAEVGGNHDGNVEKALLLVEQAALAGVDCVKFQIYKTEELFPKKDMAYPAVRGFKTQFDRQKSIELVTDDFRKLANRCIELGIHFTASAWNERAIDFLVDELKVPFIKVGSGDLTAIPLLKHLAQKKIPVFIATGGGTLAQIKKAVDIIGKDNIVVMHCTLPYPTKNEDLHLARIRFLQKELGTLVGYSDHTVDIDACVGAAYMGATVIEKHFASNKGYKCTGDHKVSAEFEELKELVKKVKKANWQIGDFTKKFDDMIVEDTRLFGSRLRRSLRATKNIKKGEIISEKNVHIIRPEHKGIPALHWDEVIGTKTLRDVKKEEYLQWHHVKKQKK